MRVSGRIVLSLSLLFLILISTFTFVSAVDYRNAYLIRSDGSACDNLAYAKNMGYDYVGYQYGMEKCEGDINLYFYIESPEQKPQLISDYIYFDKSYTDAQKKERNDFLLWKSNASFPNNIATGWFFSSTNFRPLADFQQQRVIDSVVNESLSLIKSIEDPDKHFFFGGWSWDVPSLKGDLWSSPQSNGGKQVDISYWTGSCSGFKHPGVIQDYACYSEGKAAFYKKLFSETKKQYPNMKIYMDPYLPWFSYMGEIASRSDVAQLKPDILCEEYGTLEFVTDSRLFASGLMTKDKVCSSTTYVFDHKGNLEIAGNAGINGAWFLWFGKFGGTGNFPNYDSIRQIPDRLKLIRAMPGWDNVNGVALKDRKWDASKLEYSSNLSFANMNIIYSTHPKNKKIYLVILNRSAGVNLKGKVVDTIYSVDELFSPKANASGDFTQSNGYLYLKSDSNLGKGYILTLKNTPTTSNASNVSVVSLCNDSDGGNFTFKRGSAFGRYTTGVSFNLTDSCFVSGGVSRIREFFCVSNVVREGNYTCQYGCSNGACLSAPKTNTTNTTNTSNTTSTVPTTTTSSSSSSKKSSGGGGGSRLYCGDGVCTSSKENCSSCPSDCGNCIVVLYCGDGVCTAGSEDCSSCSSDCGICEVVEPDQGLESFEENVEVPLEIIGVGEVESRSEKASEINVQKSSRMYRPALSYLMVVLSIVSLTAGFMFLQKKEKDNLSLLHINSFSHFSREYPKHAKDILKYIKKAKSLGHSDYLIKYNLLNGGWPEHIVSSALEIQEEA